MKSSFLKKKKRPLSNKFTRKKRRKKLLKLLFVFFALFSLLASIFYFLFFTDYLNYKNIEIKNTKVINKNQFFAYLQSSGIFSKERNLILFPSNELIKIAKEYSFWIKDVDVSKNIFTKTIKINIKEFTPIGVVCNKIYREEDKIIKEGCYFINKDGIIFAEAPKIEGKLFVFFNDPLVSFSDLKKTKFSKKNIDFVLKAKKNLDLFTKGVDYFYLNEEYREVLAYLNSGYVVYFSLDLPIDEQLDILITLLNEKLKDKVDNLEYIDLRIKNRAYFKMKDTN